MWRLFKLLRWIWGTLVFTITLGIITNTLTGSPLTDEVLDFLQTYWIAFASSGAALVVLTLWAAWSRHKQYQPRKTDLPESDTLANRNRKAMLDKVRAIWIDGRLNKSLYRKMLITLGLSDHPEAVEHPIDSLVQPSNQAERSRAPGTKIIDVYDEFGGEVLILGTPGAGKTTLLLELTRDLLDRALEDATHPIPVVFPLSAWAEQQRPIEDWLADEFQRLYGVGSQLAKKWIAENQIVPLLDGLDEIPVQSRTACIEHLNAFQQEHGLLPLVVSSRVKDYEAIRVPLRRLRGAIMIQPLRREQVEAYLVRAGSGLAALRQALRNDETLWEWDANTQSRLLDTPLMLNIVRLAYTGQSTIVLPTHQTLEERRQHIFEVYVRQMFARRGRVSPYTSRQTVHWLSWLARQMERHSQTIFYIEGLRPDWLITDKQQKLVRIGTNIIAGLFGGLAVGLFGGLFGGLVGGLALGLVGGWPSGCSSGWTSGWSAG